MTIGNSCLNTGASIDFIGCCLKRLEEESLQFSHHLLLVHPQKKKDETRQNVAMRRKHCRHRALVVTAVAPSRAVSAVIPQHPPPTLGLHQPRARSRPATQITVFMEAVVCCVHNVPILYHVQRIVLIETFLKEPTPPSSPSALLSHTPVTRPSCEAVTGKVLLLSKHSLIHTTPPSLPSDVGQRVYAGFALSVHPMRGGSYENHPAQWHTNPFPL